MKRPSEKPCRERCGRTTRSASGVCRACQPTDLKSPWSTRCLTYADESFCALTGGRWVLDQRRRVMVWQEAS